MKKRVKEWGSCRSMEHSSCKSEGAGEVREWENVKRTCEGEGKVKELLALHLQCLLLLSMCKLFIDGLTGGPAE